MTGRAIVGKILLIIDLIQYAFPDASISAIASAASVLFTILFILCGCQAMRFMLFPNASVQKIIYPPWEPSPDMFAKKASQNTSSSESTRFIQCHDYFFIFYLVNQFICSLGIINGWTFDFP